MLPIAAAIMALALSDTRGDRSVPSMLLGAAAVAAGVVAGFESTGDSIDYRGFEATTWGSILAAGALLCAARATFATGDASARAAASIAGGLAAASMFAPDLLWLGVLMSATTLATFAAVALEGEDLRGTLAAAGGDVLVLAGLAIASKDSLSLSPPVHDIAGVLVIAGAVLRMGVIPSLINERGTARPLVTGVLRAQGGFVCMLAVAGGSGRGIALASLGAAAGVVAWISGVMGKRYAAAAIMPAATAAAGFGLGGSIATIGAMAALAAGLAAAAAPRSFARHAYSVAPTGGLFFGVAAVFGVSMHLGASRPEYLPIAVGLGLGVLAATSSAWRTTGEQTDDRAPLLAGAASVLVLGALAFAPAAVRDQALIPALGSATPGAVSSFAPTTDLMIAAAVLAVLGLFIGGAGRAVSTPEAAAAPVVLPRPIVAGLLAAQAGCAAWLFVSAGSRGWL